MLRHTQRAHIKIFGIDLPRMSAVGSPDHNRRAVVAHLVHNKHLVPELFMMNRRSLNGRRKQNAKQHRLASGVVPGAAACHIDEYCAAPSLGSLRTVVAQWEERAAVAASKAKADESAAAAAVTAANDNSSERSQSSEQLLGGRRGINGRGTARGKQRSVDNNSSSSSNVTVDGRARRARGLRAKELKLRGGGARSVAAATTAASEPTAAITTASPSLSEAGATSQSLTTVGGGDNALDAFSPSSNAVAPLLTPQIAKAIVSVVDHTPVVERGWLYGGGGGDASGGSSGSSGRLASAGAAAVGFHCLTRCSHGDNVIREVDREGTIVDRMYVCPEAAALLRRAASEAATAFSSSSEAAATALPTAPHRSSNNTTRSEENVSPTAASAAAPSSRPSPLPPPKPPHSDAPQHVETIVRAAMGQINKWALREGAGGAEAVRAETEQFIEAQRVREGLSTNKNTVNNHRSMNDENAAAAVAARRRAGGLLASPLDAVNFGGSAQRQQQLWRGGPALSFDLKLPQKLIRLVAPTPLLQSMLCAAVASALEGRGAFSAVKAVSPVAGLDPRAQDAMPLSPVDALIRSLSVSASLHLPTAATSSNPSSKTNAPSSSSAEPAVLRVSLHHDGPLRHLFDLIGDAAVVDLRLLRANVACEDYFKALAAHYNTKATSAANNVINNAESNRTTDDSATQTPTPTAPPPAAVVSLAVAWPEDRLIKISSVFTTVMRYRNKESIEMRRKGAAATTAAMKRRAVRTLAAWWLGFGQRQYQLQKEGARRTPTEEADEADQSPFASFPRLPSEDGSTNSTDNNSSNSNDSNVPHSSLYFGACRRLRVCGDKEFMFVNLCRPGAGDALLLLDAAADGSLANNKNNNQKTNRKNAAALEDESATRRRAALAEGQKRAGAAMWAAIRHITSAATPAAPPSSASSSYPFGSPSASAASRALAGALLGADNGDSPLLSASSLSASTSADASAPPTVIECVLEKRGLTHEHIVEEVLQSLTDMREERIIRLLTAVAEEGILNAGGGGGGGVLGIGESESDLYGSSIAEKTEVARLYAEVAARRFFEQHLGPLLPRLVCSVTAVVEAPSHAHQRLRIRGSTLADVSELAGKLLSAAPASAAAAEDGAEGSTNGNSPATIAAASSAAAGGHMVSYAGAKGALPFSPTTAGARAAAGSLAAQMLSGDAARAAAASSSSDSIRSGAPKPTSVLVASAGGGGTTSSATTPLLSTDAHGIVGKSAANSVEALPAAASSPHHPSMGSNDDSSGKGAAITAGINNGGVPTAPNSSASAASSSSSNSSIYSASSSFVAPLPPLLGDRVDRANFLPPIFATHDGAVVGGRLTPFGEDESLEGKRINVTSGMGRFKRNVFGKSFYRRNADGIGATTEDAEAAEFWREHFYLLHCPHVVYDGSGAAANSEKGANAGGFKDAAANHEGSAAIGSGDARRQLPATPPSDSASNNGGGQQQQQQLTAKQRYATARGQHLQHPPQNNAQTLASLKARLAAWDAAAAAAADLRIGALAGYAHTVTLRNILPSQLPLVQFAVRRAAGAAAVSYAPPLESLRAMERAGRAAARAARAAVSSCGGKSASAPNSNSREGATDVAAIAPSHISHNSKKRLLLTATCTEEVASASASPSGAQPLENATGFLNYFAMNRFSWYTRGNAHPGLHLLKGEFRTAMDVIAPRTDHEAELGGGKGGAFTDFEVLGFAPKGGLDPRSRRQRAQQKGEQKVARIVRRAREEAGLAAETEEGCREVFASVVGPAVCQLLVNEFLSFVWNEVLSHRVRRYGRRTILVGDLIRPRDPKTGNPLPLSSTTPRGGDASGIVGDSTTTEATIVIDNSQTYGAAAGAGGGGGPIYATAEDIVTGRYTYRDVVMPIPGAGVALPRHDGLVRMYISTLQQYGIRANCEASADGGGGGPSGGRIWEVFYGSKRHSNTNAPATSSSNNSGVSVARPQGPNPLGLAIRGGYRYAYELPRDFSCAIVADDTFDEAMGSLLAVKRDADAAAREAGADVRALEERWLGGGGDKIDAHRRQRSEQQRYRAPPASVVRTYRSLGERLAATPLKATLRFHLPASAYAPMLVRELTRYPHTDLKDVLALRRHLSTSEAVTDGELAMKAANLSAEDAYLKRRWLTRRGRRSTEMGRALMLATLRKQVLRPAGKKAKMIGSMLSMKSDGLAVD